MEQMMLELAVGEPGGRVLRFPAAWLRDNCPCADCRDPVTGQRLLDLAGIADPVIVSVSASASASAFVSAATCVSASASAFADPSAEATVVVTFGPDGHQSEFDRSWLAANAPDEPAPADLRTEDAKTLWPGGDVGRLPEADWAALCRDDTVRAAVLEAVLRHGVAVLRGVPTEPAMVLAVAETFGYVRETNYGRLFDVQVEPAPGNLAYTSREILPHTDNPYRDPVPTVQLLHCLRDAASGGDTLLIDGFAAAAQFRAQAPEAFAMLTRTPWRFRYTDQGADLRAQAPLIGLDPRGRIREVRFNSRSMEPLRGTPAAHAEAAYAAYVAWARLLRRPELAARLRLTPGDCLILDNTRILHARTAFSALSATGGRHLQGCYADLDGLASTLSILRGKAAS